MDNQQMPVSLDAVNAVTAQQRNAAMDRVAQLEAALQQVVAERDELAAEVERLRGETDA